MPCGPWPVPPEIGGPRPDRTPALPPLGLPGALAGVVAVIEGRTRALGRPVRVDWGAAVAGRASLLGPHQQGRISANRTCRLLRTGDGWIALNLPRPDDMELLPALIGRNVTDPWPDVMSAAACRSTEAFVGQARLLGLAASPVPTADAAPGLSAHLRHGPAQPRHGPTPPPHGPAQPRHGPTPARTRKARPPAG